MGYDNLDGLIWQSAQDKEALFISTDAVLRNYLARHRQWPHGWAQLARYDDFYTAVFSWDAALVRGRELPLTRAGTQLYADTFLGLFAQDTGPFAPDRVLVFAAQPGRIRVATAHIEGGMSLQIPQCKAAWDALAARSQASLARYRASGLKDQAALRRSAQQDMQADAAYQKCYAQAAPAQPRFGRVDAQAQALLERMQ
jgi:hypothetical protein